MDDPELEAFLAAVEQRLSALGDALRDQDVSAIEQHANELHRALATAVQHFSQVARRGGVPPPLRKRLAHATAKVAAQRESLARATAALDRAIDVLMPGITAASAAVYSRTGNAERGRSGGVLKA
jgi:uncharacterized membrane protein YccC